MGKYSPSVGGHTVLLPLGDIQSYFRMGKYSPSVLGHTVLFQLVFSWGTYSPSPIGGLISPFSVRFHQLGDIQSFPPLGDIQSYFSWSSVGGRQSFVRSGTYSPTSVGGHTVVLPYGGQTVLFCLGTYSLSSVWGHSILLPLGDILSYFSWSS